MQSDPFASHPSLAADLKSACQAFREQFGCEPRWAASAPGRVNLIGEHVDYNDGLVLPMAIERQTVVVGGPQLMVAAAGEQLSDSSVEGARTRVYSAVLDELQWIPWPAARGPKLTGWIAYVQGVLVGMEQRGMALRPINLAVSSSVPLGGGLSSSAAMEVSVATLIEAASGRELSRLEKIQLCQTAEHLYAQVPCGIMDQFAVTLSQANHLMLLDCRSLQIELLPLQPPAPAVLIINSNVRHQLADSQYALRRQECRRAADALGVASLRDISSEDFEQRAGSLPATIRRRARHVVSEIERTRQAAEGLRRRDWSGVGELLYQSHASLRDDYEVSCPEVDVLVEHARQLGLEAGVYGARITGGGFGGCVVALVAPATLEQVTGTLVDGYRRATGIEPSWIVTRPAAGARTLSLDAPFGDV